MENSFNQLRFDISEKVRLHPQQAGIGNLLELDLYPDVQIKDEGQHLRIQGYLRLNGTYLTKQEEPSYDELVHTDTDVYGIQRQEIAYVIPVEITLPAERVEMAHISTEVETFDYQVLSPFELQIEAILMIDGLLPDQQEEWGSQEAEKEDAYPYPVFSGSPAQSLSIWGEEVQNEKKQDYQKEKIDECNNAEGSSSPEKVTKPVEPMIEESKDLKVIDSQPTAPRMAKKEVSVPEELNQKELNQKERTLVNPPKSKSEQSEETSLTQSSEKTEQSVEKKESLESNKSQPASEPKEVKSEVKEPHEKTESKKSEHHQEDPPKKENSFEKLDTAPMVEESIEDQPAQKLKEVETEKKAIEDQTEPEKPNTHLGEQKEEESHSSTHWINWLVKNKEESFAPMRMVIVQKNDSLDQIAERYEVSTGHLLRVNHLQSDQLAEGQMLYIPKNQSQL
ncbi:LysM peptidoglycan-binding domain-containing protein [Hazenella coriacea]|uniref:Stage VI sporulation protein D n=1 Tax=Hazenella coriacea TaxID=1179467 RepID=A0A4R3L901_9BACL|nr:LysM peptidoglycan-binding domain-containing protein [Hazenella coriacea]TCS96521.1 stage VI sporulation protein D [Hazenella coriacea]